MRIRGLTAVSVIAGLLLIAAVACSSPAASPAPAQTPPSTSEPATVVPTPSEPAVEPAAPATEPTVEPVSPEEPTVEPITPDAGSTETATVSGTVAYRERIALSSDAVVEVKLVDVSLADAPSKTIAEITIADAGQVPISFEIEYDPEAIDERFTYAIQAKIYERGELRFVTATHYPVLTRDSASHDLDIVLQKVGPSEPVDATPTALALSVCMVTKAVALPIEFEYNGTVPTGFDGINKANCSFTKAIETITVTLTGPATHSEVFTLAEPTTAVSFPLPEGTLSITTMEIVPAGEYERTITLTSVDGDSLVLSDEPGVLSTVTIVEPVAFELGVCMMTLATQLPIEFEYNGTIPTGFDGINKANCSFTKAIETITVTLTGPATHSEVFTLAEPTTAVSFPLPEGTLSITTMEIVPAGEYERTITLTSVDGDSLVLSDEPGVLSTVTITEAK